MNSRYVLTPILLVAMFASASLFAQKAPAKFGDVSMEDLKMTSYSPDTSAAGVVLVDFGESYLRYSQDKGFNLVFERHRRIKILKPEGLHLADHKIMTYHRDSRKEKVIALKATTFTLENGKVVETKMKNDAVFEKPFDDRFDMVSYSLPNVKVGSVLDITYTINSDFFFNFQDWEFQSTIPTVWSEYRARIPEYFNYDKYVQGYVAFEVNEATTGNGQIILRNKQRQGDLVSNTSFEEHRIDFVENRFRWVAKDVPAFKEEPYMTAASDYLSKINFELAFTKFPYEAVENYMGSWEQINRTYYENADFGGEVKGNAFLSKTVAELTAGMTDNAQKISAIVHYVKKNIQWDGRSTNYSASRLKKVLEDKKGNCAEINLLIASMLEKAGIEAYPVLLSTRDHGFIRQSYPQSTQFNYVLCLARFDGKEVLLDGTEPLLPVNIIPERCLNGQGMAVTQSGPRWVPLTAGPRTRVVAISKLAVDAGGMVKGEVTVERTGYAALNQRKDYLKKGEQEYLKELTAKHEWTVSKSAFENLDKVHESFKEKFEIETDHAATASGDVLYLNPFLLLQKTSNPFRLERREYPVDFGYANDEVYVVNITIPEGYVVDELPKPKMMVLPENASKFGYNVAQTGNVISISSNFSINKSLFVQDEYPYLREFFNQVVAKQAEQIVLKKKI